MSVETGKQRTDYARLDLRASKFKRQDLIGADFSGADLRGASFHLAKLQGASFANADLAGTDFSGANVDGTDFRGCHFSPSTDPGVASSEGAHIDRYTLEAWSDTGSSTHWKRVSTRLALDINDDVATLRASFSGFWAWVHLVAMTAFVVPHIAFVVRHWFSSEPSDPGVGSWTPMWNALWNQVRSGGRGITDAAATDVWAIWLFRYLLTYNVCRATLLTKTMKLELDERIKGLPAKFSLKHPSLVRVPWSWLHWIVKWGFWLNLLIVASYIWGYLSRWINVA